MTRGDIVATTAAVKRRKPRDARKETSVRVRLTEEEKVKLEAGAAKARLDLSAWVRATMLREAEKD